jgi:hypothetical protein
MKALMENRLDYQIGCWDNSELIFIYLVGIIPTPIPKISTPLFPSEDDFVSIAKDFHIAGETATILDDMRSFNSMILEDTKNDQGTQDHSKIWAAASNIVSRLSSIEAKRDSLIISDYVHECCRNAALIHCKIFGNNAEASLQWTSNEIEEIWESMWHVDLARWKQIPGIFLWVLLATMPAMEESKYKRVWKNMLRNTSSYLALDHWEIVDATLWSYARMQKWLRNRDNML